MGVEYNKNTDGSLMDKDQIVKDIPLQVSEDDLDTIRNMKTADLITLHHGLGTWIRNSYGLWAEDYPYIPKGSNADDFSFEIIEEFHASILPIQRVTIK